MSEEFDKKHGADPRENPRCRLRLLDSIEKMRKLLTANKESDLHCEALLEDQDLHKPFTREQFEELIEPWIGEFRACLEESIAKSGKCQINKLRQARVAGSTPTDSSLTIAWSLAFCREPPLNVSSWVSVSFELA